MTLSDFSKNYFFDFLSLGAFYGSSFSKKRFYPTNRKLAVIQRFSVITHASKFLNI